jgi:photosystem II stability/assembly factor-like uncharacterized protein
VAAAAAAQPFDDSVLAATRWRMIGPFRGGRALAITGVPGKPDRFYFGAVGGGVWRTDNAGRTWQPVFDGQPIASIGAIAVAPSNPEVVYVGSGEADMRSDISYGNGMYRSIDGGKSWTRIGLEDSRQIGRVLVDPKNPDLVFVAALGHAYGGNAERGVFRSQDGGKTWRRVLHTDDNTGAIDLAFEPGNARTILAALWQTRRPPWNVYPPSNGPGSGLYRSDDGGETWHPLTGHGFPSEGLGRVGIAFAPSDPKRVYAIVDAKEGGLYASEDGGANWKRASSDRRIWERGWYFGEVAVDSKDPNSLYVCDTAMYKSTDAGKSFLPVKGAPGGDDYHQLWIDPGDPVRMAVASDQGAVVSVDGGRTWSSWYNQPTAQIYRVVTDNRFPYWVYGAQQDSGAVASPSRTDYRGITLRDWRPIAVGGESGEIAPDPEDPNVLFGGTVGRYDRTTMQELNVDPTLNSPGAWRKTWTLPLTFSPRDPRRLYFSHQVLFETKNGGDSWESISPDLTREDPGDPPNLDAATATDNLHNGHRRGVIYAIAPSPVARDLVWCGTDDGFVWVTRDDGKHWDNVTPQPLTAWSKIAMIDASHFDVGTAFLAVDRHRLDDLAPYIYRTRDGGKTWKEISAGITAGSYVNAVREDPVRKGLLYAGTETGVFVSFDEGEHWQSLQRNMPNCSVRDISVRGNDIVIATHGRSFWIADDVSALRQLDSATASADAWLFAPAPAVRLHPAGFQGTPEPKDEPSGENPPRGAFLDYLLRATPSTPVVLEILDSKGQIVRRYASDEKTPGPDLQKIQTAPDWAPAPKPLEATPGAHRFVWDLRYTAQKALASPSSYRDPAGLWAPPGRYTVRLTAAGRSLTQPFAVIRDPRIKASDADLLRQFELAKEIEGSRVRVAGPLRQAQALRKQITSVREKAAGQASLDLEGFAKKLDGAAGPPETGGFEESESAETSSLRSVSARLQRLASAVESADAAPTLGAQAGFAGSREPLERSLASWTAVLNRDLPRVNESLKQAALPPLTAD